MTGLLINFYQSFQKVINMAIQTTNKLDVVLPEIFEPYVIHRTAELSSFWQSGIVQNVPGLNIGTQGGDTVNFPFWQDLAGEDQLLDSQTDLEVNKIEAGRDVAVLNTRALVYGATDLAAAFAGDDPVRAIGDLYAAKWARRLQVLLLSMLNGAMGAMASESGSPNVLDISGLAGNASDIDGASFIDANQKLGDAKDQLAAVVMHSAVNASLAKQGLIETIRDKDNEVLYQTFMGKRVIQVDAMPVDNGVYTSYLFGAGAVGYGEGTPKNPSAVQRDELKNGGEEYLVSRRHIVLHTRGIRWDPGSGVPAKDTPTNAELANTANWQLVYEPKHVRIVQFKHTIS